MLTKDDRARQVNALLMWLSDDDCDIMTLSDENRRLIKHYLYNIGEEFNIQKAFDYLSSIIKEKVRNAKYAEVFSRSKGGEKSDETLYRDIMHGSEFTHYPNKEVLIRLCFNLDIRDEAEVNSLMDNMYVDRLYFKNKKDIAYYYFLFISKSKWKEAKDWMEQNIRDSQKCYSIKKSDQFDKKYTAEVYDEIKNLKSKDDLMAYLQNNEEYFSQKPYMKVTAKHIISDTITGMYGSNNPGNDDHIRLIGDAIVHLEDFDDTIGHSLLVSLSKYHPNNNYAKDASPPLFAQDKVTGKAAKMRRKGDDFYKQWIERKVYNSAFTRGNYLMILVVRLETAGGIEQGDSDQYDGVIRRLNNSLEEAGYAPLNRDGVLIDKIICDLLECYLNQGNSNSGRTGLKSFTKLLFDFIDAATGGTLDEICTGSRKSTS